MCPCYTSSPYATPCIICIHHQKKAWLDTQVQKQPPLTFLTHGACIPLLGIPHYIQVQPWGRRTIKAHTGKIWITGPTPLPMHRLRDWLRRKAMHECEIRARAMSLQLGASYTQITVRELRSRWGSCSETGHLCFAWRLIFAPEDILTYVVAHEVAHLVEMNHSRRFWNVVASLIGSSDKQKRWLKEYGHTLHAYDPSQPNHTGYFLSEKAAI